MRFSSETLHSRNLHFIVSPELFLLEHIQNHSHIRIKSYVNCQDNNMSDLEILPFPNYSCQMSGLCELVSQYGMVFLVDRILRNE